MARCNCAVRGDERVECFVAPLLSTVQLVNVRCPAPTVDSGWALLGWLPAAVGTCAAAEAGCGTGARVAVAAAGCELSRPGRPPTDDSDRSRASITTSVLLGRPVGYRHCAAPKAVGDR